MTPDVRPRRTRSTEQRVARPRLAIVTGSSSGIGRAIAALLLDDGWRIAGLDAAPATLRSRRFESHRVDLTDEQATLACATALADADALVHAAGVLRVAPLGQLDQDPARLMWRVHVNALERIANVVIPAMAARGEGRVVLIGSRVARGVAGRSQYAATKAAVIALARSWAAEVVSAGVTVNVVSPAATRTAMSTDRARKSVAPRVPPIGRLIEPAEIAALVSYLLSPVAAAITGQNIQICGGASLG